MSDHHSTLAPSSLPAILKCAQFRSRPGNTEWSLKGNEHHVEFARLIKGDASLASQLPLEERAGVEWAAQYVRGLASAEALRVEDRIKIFDDQFNEISFGTIDAWQPNVAMTWGAPAPELENCTPEIWDYKSGYVFRDYDPQMAAYALGAMQRTGTKRCYATILWGRRQFAEKRLWEYAEALALVLKAKAAREDQRSAPVICDYCGWCNNTPICSAYLARVEALRVARPDWQLAHYHADRIDDPAEMAKALALAKQLKDWIEAVEERAADMAKRRGLTLPGWKLKERKGARVIGDMAKGYERAGLPILTFLACCDLSLPALEIAFAKETGATVFKAAQRDLAEKLGDALSRKESKSYLTKEKDNDANS